MKNVVIMGGGPAGLSCGYLLEKNDYQTTIIEADSQVGGISKTVEYKGNYFDLGGHRFFTKIEEVNELWTEILGENFRKTPRLSRIYYKNKFFNYPLTAMNALMGVGLLDTFSIIGSYVKSRIAPMKPEETFEQWVSNRFGYKLYSMFFKTYTEKVWGIPCTQLQAEWAAQRIKGLSLATAVWNALFKPKGNNIKTLIDEFDYPVKGPGMMYTAMAEKIENMGGKVSLNSKVVKVNHENFIVKSVEVLNGDGTISTHEGDQFISSIPITELVKMMSPSAPQDILEAASKLVYRSLMTVDIVVNKETLFPDNWIYIHSPEVKLGRIQNFKNWSRDMVADPRKTTLGLEYFCDQGDEFWNLPDSEVFKIAASEVEKISICKASEIEDYTIIRVPKAYPSYLMGYKEYIKKIENYLRRFSNMQEVGRYGLFKYNNMDHSILTGLYAAKNIINGKYLYDVWEVNTDDEYHEEKVEKVGKQVTA